MPRKNKWVKLIDRIKFLNDSKYYKNNIWSLADWDSWAAQGKCGYCQCCFKDGYNASLENKRYTGKNHCSTNWKGNTIVKVCYDCKNKIEEIIGYKFETR